MLHRANSTIYKAIAYIYDNYTQDISLVTIADYLHIQPQSLSNLLSKYLKTDLRNYINNLRIQEFYVLQKRPENKDLSVLELATLCGFSSLTTFYRAKKNTSTVRRLTRAFCRRTSPKNNDFVIRSRAKMTIV